MVFLLAMTSLSIGPMLGQEARMYVINQLIIFHILHYFTEPHTNSSLLLALSMCWYKSTGWYGTP